MQFDLMELMTALDNAGIDHENFRGAYGGRGMGDRTCPAVTVTGMSEMAALFVALGFQAGENSTDGDDQAVMDLAGRVRTDSMGHDMIVYFPGVELTGEGCSCYACAD